MILDVLYLIYFIIYFPVLLVRRKWHAGFIQRFGHFPVALLKELSGGRNIWVHAVSVGEVSALEGVIKGLQSDYPGHRIVLSVTTKTGHDFASRKYNGQVCLIWAPLDFSLVVGRFVQQVRPVMYVATETELWPHLFNALHRHGVAIVLVNGRISDAAYPYYRWFRWLCRSVMAKIKLVCAQDSLDAARFVALGVPSASVHVVGNVKFDVKIPAVVFTSSAKEAMGFQAQDMVWVAASTHPGEEEIVVDVFKALRARFPLLRLVLAPRHPERKHQVASLVRKKRMSPVFLTERGRGLLGAEDILVVDAVGHLLEVYQACDVVVMGKSLGISRRGGQNPVEAAALAKPVIVGPSMENFRDVLRLFKEAEAIIEVNAAHDLQRVLQDMLQHPGYMADVGIRAKAVVENNRGAVDRTLALIRQA